MAACGARAAVGDADDRFLSSVSPDELANFVAAFHEGLRETGYVEGRNVTIEYRFVRGHNDRLPEFAADLLRRGVDVIAAPGSPSGTVAAKAATTTIPSVFFLGAIQSRAGLSRASTVQEATSQG